MHVVDLTMYYAAEGGGISSYLNAKARWLARHSRIRHTILSSSAEGGAVPAVIALPGIALPGIHGYRVPRSIAGPARLALRCAPDLLEAGDAGHCAWAALRVGRRLHVPVVGFYHSDLHALVARRFGPLAAGAAGKYLARLYRQFDLVLAPSRLMVQRLDGLGVPGAVHQPLGVDSSVFCPARRDASLRERLGLPAHTRLLVYAGRFTAEKRLDLLIEAARRLGRPYHLLLVGGGHALPAAPHVTVLPFQRDPRALARLLASCNLLVHPGDCETFGLIVLEAMACGLPVLGTGGGVAELIDADTGLLTRPGHVPSLCAGIEALFRADLVRLGACARRKAREQYDWNRVMPQLLARYAAVLPAARHGWTDPPWRHAGE